MIGRLYLADSYLREFDAIVLSVEDGWCELSATAFFPGGGGQPHDRGHLVFGGAELQVTDVREDDDAHIWHRFEESSAVGGLAPGGALAPGDLVRGAIDWPYRYALMRHHGLMHMVNAVAFREFGGIITGVQIGPERSRIDFRLAGFSRERVPEFERLVNDALALTLPVTCGSIGEEEFRRRPELVRTLNVLPPVVDGMVRVVEMEGFDAQACGGTHVASTAEIGRTRVDRFDNKGKDNKRFYWELVDRTG
jgi:misacylated tRNA(Ala) deacylase